MKNLSVRLKTICEIAKKSKRIADVGCDHGKVLGYLVENNKPKFVIASDISAPSANKAQILLQKQSKVKFSVRVGDGFSTLSNSDRLDTIIVSGVGGLEIINILKNSKIKTPKLILQPQNNVVKLRQYLTLNGYKIVNEYILKEKHIYYTILVVKKGKQKLTDLQIKYGLNIHCLNIELANYLKFLQDGYKKRLNMVNDLQKQELATCINEIESIIKEGK